MSRFRLFIENFLVYGLGSMISQIIPFIMLPIVTSLMADPYYFGLNDISTIVVSFGSALAVMGFYDAMYRLFFEKEDDKYRQEICSTALAFTLMTSLIIFLVLLIFNPFFTKLFFSSGKLGYLLLLSSLSILIGATNSIIAAPTRMQNKRKIYLFFNTISPIISYSIAIPLLLNGQYIIALPLAAVISALTLEISFFFLNKKWFSFKSVRKAHLIELLKIGIPLLPNFLIYWVFNSSDKLMIAKILGTQFTGIYAVGGKIGQFSQLIYTAFAGGWQYFSFSTMNDEDQVEMVSKVFEYLGIITFIAAMLMCTFNQIIFNILFTGEYIAGAIVSPYLFLAPLIQMLYQVAANQFLIIKKTWPTMLILSFGAIVNIVLNIFGIKYLGIEGAAISTLIGYVVSTIICVSVLSKSKLFAIKKRFLFCTGIFVAFLVGWRLVYQGNFVLTFMITIIVSIILISFYKNDILSLLKSKKQKPMAE